LRGDAYASLGDRKKAYQSYQLSLLMLSPGSRARVLLEMKANDLGDISQNDVIPEAPKQEEPEKTEPDQS